MHSSINKERCVGIFCGSLLFAIFSTFFLVVVQMYTNTTNSILLIKAVCFAAWCALWIVSGVIVFILVNKKRVKFVAGVTSIFVGVSTFLSTILLNSYSYFLTYIVFSGEEAYYFEFLANELSKIKIYLGAFFIGFLTSFSTLIIINKYCAFACENTKGKYDATKGTIKVDIYKTLVFMGQMVSSINENQEPYIIAVESKQGKVNVLVNGKESQIEDLVKYILISAAKIRKNNGAEFFEVLDDFSMLSEIAVAECFYKSNIEEDGV